MTARIGFRNRIVMYYLYNIMCNIIFYLKQLTSAGDKCCVMGT